MTTVEVVVTARPETLDPEARTIRRSLRASGSPVDEVAAGRWFLLEFPGLEAEEALGEARRLAEEILANPVVHEVRVAIADG